MLSDPWLDRWLALAKKSVGASPVLEIGCGSGADTATLTEAGFEVIAFDVSADAVAQAKRRAPRAIIECKDAREPFHPAARELGVIVASLSLHYFPWSETEALLQRIRAALRPGGLLLCRLNSTQDRHFGAHGHPQIEPDFFLVDGAPKRFFDRRSVDALFSAGWLVVSAQHLVTGKYGLPKALWEVVATKVE